ncbi:MAG: glycosyltransferase family 39 protein [Pirellulaceae bacterium]|nr:glycosyltransferase family 39 protein [Pirellulaceae bacterium]
MKTIVKQHKWLLLVLLMALLMRLAVVGFQFESLSATDPDSYRAIAVNLVETGTYSLDADPTAFRPPVYPLILSLGMFLGIPHDVWVGGIHILFGVLTVLLTYRVALMMNRKPVALLAATLVCVDPILLNQSVLTMTETTATLLGILAIWLLVRTVDNANKLNIVLTGVTLGVAGLCRPTFFVFAAMGLLVLMFSKTVPWKKQLHTNLLVGCCLLVTIAPWVIRNQISLGKPVIATTHGGYTLLLGNNPLFYEHLDQPLGTYSAQHFDRGVRRFNISENPSYDFWAPRAMVQPKVISRNEIERDRFAYEVAKYHISQQPKLFARSIVRRVGKLWSPLPNAGASNESSGRFVQRLAVGGWYLTLFVVVFWFSVRQSNQWLTTPMKLGIVMILAFTLVHAVYWSDMRMRAPLMPTLYLAAALALIPTPTTKSPEVDGT